MTNRKHILPDFTFPEDPHKAVGSDFASLDALYQGRVACFGDYHAHSNSGGTSDGHTTPEEWLAAMTGLHMDFIGLMDHRQVRHMYLDSFDPDHFLYGSEPAGLWHEQTLDCHYLMLFQDRGALERVLDRFPDVFEFEGGVEGHFKYLRMARERFLQVRDAVLEEGGAFVNAHPKQQIKSDDLEMFNFGDGTALETIYTCKYDEQLNRHTIANYRLWVDMLAAGYKMVNTATSDCHDAPKNAGVNTVYVSEKTGPAYVRQLIAGDLNAGFVGVKMALDGHPVGSTIEWREGMTLEVGVDDVHPTLFDPAEAYRVDVLTDEGLAYSAPLTLPFRAALQAEKRRFYRVEVLRESDGSPAAIGNPIWLV